jgi:hypothetical protein
MERACARALHCGTISYKGVQTILKSQLDLQPLDDEPRSHLALPWHENSCSPSYHH